MSEEKKIVWHYIDEETPSDIYGKHNLLKDSRNPLSVNPQKDFFCCTTRGKILVRSWLINDERFTGKYVMAWAEIIQPNRVVDSAERIKALEKQIRQLKDELKSFTGDKDDCNDEEE